MLLVDHAHHRAQPVVLPHPLRVGRTRAVQHDRGDARRLVVAEHDVAAAGIAAVRVMPDLAELVHHVRAGDAGLVVDRAAEVGPDEEVGVEVETSADGRVLEVAQQQLGGAERAAREHDAGRVDPEARLRLFRGAVHERPLDAAHAPVLDQDPLGARVAVDAPARLRDPRYGGDQLRHLAIVRAAELGPAAADAVHARGRRRMPFEAECRAACAHQPIVLVEQLLAGHVHAQLAFDRVPVRAELALGQPLDAALAPPARQPVRGGAKGIAPVVHGAAAHGLRVVQEHRVVGSRIETAPAVEIGHRVLFPLREILRAEEAALLDEHDVPAALGQVRRERAAPGAGPDHHDVGAVADRGAACGALDDHAISPKSIGYAGICTRSGHGPVNPVSARVSGWM